MSISFGLRAEYQGTVPQDIDGETRDVPVYSGGVIAIDGDRSFDIGAALDAGDGVITIDDTEGPLVRALSEYPALKRLTGDEVPADATPLSEYDTMTVAALRDEANRRGLDGHGRASKAALVAALREHDDRLADGDQAVNSPDTRIDPDPAEGIVAPGDDTPQEG